jgi:hypothetical protein
MKNLLEEHRKLIGQWVVPITKDCDTRSEAKLVKVNLETKVAKLTNGKFVLVRKLTSDDVRSLDFIKYIKGFKQSSIVRLEKNDPVKVSGKRK